jgi:hypothetical protein
MTLPCPCCLADAAIQLNLLDGDTLTCPDCDEEFTVDYIDSLITVVGSWGKILPWLLSHPARVKEPAAV